MAELEFTLLQLTEVLVTGQNLCGPTADMIAFLKDSIGKLADVLCYVTVIRFGVQETQRYLQ